MLEIMHVLEGKSILGWEAVKITFTGCSWDKERIHHIVFCGPYLHDPQRQYFLGIGSAISEAYLKELYG